MSPQFLVDRGLAPGHQLLDDRRQGLADALGPGQLAGAHRFLQVPGKSEHGSGPGLVGPHLKGVFPGQLQQEGDLLQGGGYLFLIHNAFTIDSLL